MVLTKQIKTTLPLQKICGQTDHHIYFSVKNPQAFVAMNRALSSAQTYSFSVPMSEKLIGSRALAIDSPWVFCYANNIPAIYYGSFGKEDITQVYLDTPRLFTKSLYISPNKSVLRRFDEINRQQFQVVDNLTGKILVQRSVVSDRGDMGFSTDGTLQYDSVSKCIIYVLNYQNLFICLDTNLNILYKAHTIDTTSFNSVSIGVLNLGGADRILPMRSRQLVNKNSLIFRDKILIISGLKADNESIKSFNENSVIDIYGLKDGHYSGSFYIPNIDGDRAKSLWTKNDTITALYDHHLAIYILDFL